ncbi:putative RNA-directed DNA polymerase [Helianthus annuus]|nr:putative RNA-directed DNA polymerase [Helianthus annuus]
MDSSNNREGHQDADGPWQEVQYRKHSKSKGDGVERTFLVQNISDKVTKSILWRSFKPYGYVSDAYVARKRDAKGKCFGFIRYVGIENMKTTLELMNTVKMFGMKANVVLAKYDKDHKRFKLNPEKDSRSEWIPKETNQRPRDCSNPHIPGQGYSGSSGIRNGMSYADLFKGRKETNSQGAKSISVEGKGSVYPLHCVGRSVVGRVKDLWNLNNIRRMLEAEGIEEFGLSYVGGLSVLVTFRDNATTKVVLDQHASTFSKVFAMHNLWNGEDVPYSRIVSLRIAGVPVLIRDNVIYDNIGGLFGEVIQPSAFSWQEEDNSTDLVKVLTTQQSRIDEAVVIKWMDRSIAIWVSEVPEKWVPKLFEDPTSEPSDSESESDTESSKSDDTMVEDEDFEEGEFRNVGSQDQSPNGEDDSPEEAIPVVDHPVEELEETHGAQAQAPEKLDGLEAQSSPGINAGLEDSSLHGEENSRLHASNEFINDDVTKKNGNFNDQMSDDVGQGGELFGSNTPGCQMGPTPGVNLGKRSRNDVSPPSIGSTQGPAQRLFYQIQDQTKEPLDLNTPVNGDYDEGVVTPNSPIPFRVPQVNDLQQCSPVGGDANFGIDEAQDRPRMQEIIDAEVQATIDVGAIIGVDLKGFVAATESVVAEEGANNHTGCMINLINVYAPNDAVGRRSLWLELLNIRNSVQGLWILMGDFNEVRDSSERLNSEFIEANADLFNQFILSAGLVEYNMGGGNFTYISDNGKKLSKLDRFLVCLGFRERWPNAAVIALDREVSDHRPIVLSSVQTDFGHIPFRFFNSWFEFPGFLDFVLFKCGVFNFSGPADLALAIKLRWLKNTIKAWLKTEKANREGMYISKKRRLSTIENLAETRTLLEEELSERVECRNFVAEFDRLKHLDLRQKSRSKWAVDGDENSAYFHHIINANISTNRLNGLMVDGVWCTNPVVIKEGLYNFFQHQFTEPMPVRPVITCPNLAQISESEAGMLEAPFTVEEIKTAIWECDGDKAPGPDGFNFKFIKRCWSGFRADFVNLFNKFYTEESINQCCTSSFIALIPKVKDPSSPQNFRPISLIGVVNKVISKVLVNRLKGVLGNLVSEQQSAFLAGRNIMDGPLILNEMFGWLKKEKRKGMFFKVDINKAYDSVNWAFLNSIMDQMKFPRRWRSWVMATLQSARASVLVNGSPTREFECSRGLRQGDPLSPFLFVIVMEALTGIMKKATKVGLFNGIKLSSEGMSLSHLLYADDAIFIGDWAVSNIKNLKRILRCFYLASGLRVNLEKCSLYGIGVEDHEIEGMADLLRCKKGNFPFKHLGLLVGANMNLERNWKPVIEIFRNRLSLWKARTLSYGGRITLIKSVLNALPTYFFSLFKAPLKVLDALDRIRRVFFWGGSEEKAKMNWVAWEKTIAPVEYGGLGFGSLRDANLAMLAKWWWRFKTEKMGLWRQVVWSIHHSSRGWSDVPAKLSIAGPWKQIVNIRKVLLQANIDLSNTISATLGNGRNISFWLDSWADSTPFYIKFPALFKTERTKTCLVHDRMTCSGSNWAFNWAWSVPALGVTEQSQLNQLIQLITGLVGLNMSDGVDKWRWDIDGSDSFKVASIKTKLSGFNRVRPEKVFEWCNWVPKKVGMVAWRAEKERLPTRCALADRNIPMQDRRCIMCGDYDETSEHIFVSCQVAQVIWQNVARWCSIPPVIAFGLKDILSIHEYSSSSATKKKALYAVVLITIWSIWKSRNEAVFQHKLPDTTKILDEIKAMAYLWVKNRAKMASLTWEDWNRFKIGD